MFTYLIHRSDWPRGVDMRAMLELLRRKYGNFKTKRTKIDNRVVGITILSTTEFSAADIRDLSLDPTSNEAVAA